MLLSFGHTHTKSENKNLEEVGREPAEAGAIWTKSVSALKEKLDPQIFAAWIQPLSVANLKDGGSLEVLAPNKFCCEHVKNHYGDIITNTISTVTGEKVLSVSFKVGEGIVSKGIVSETPKAPAKKIVVESSLGRAPATTRNRRAIGSKSLLSRSSDQTNLNPNYNFSNYVVGGCNQFSHAVSLRVAENLGAHYNPLFIYGGVGLGKTHLVNAIGNAAKRRGKKVLFVSSEFFVNELISSIRTKSMDKFKSRFRSLDLLIIDDIQFLSGKERTQEEFFHTFNELHQKNKQIVITSDKLPQELTGLEERLRTRFSSGLSADLQAPDFETRAAIIMKKAEASGISLSEDVVKLFAERIDTNVRELEGALNRAQALSSLQDMPITMALAEEVLKSCALKMTRDITPELIQKIVSEKYNVSISELLGKRRTQNIAFARHVAMHICRDLTGCSYPEIGALFGGRDHSTVIHANRVIDQRRKDFPEINEDVVNLIAKIKG